MTYGKRDDVTQHKPRSITLLDVNSMHIFPWAREVVGLYLVKNELLATILTGIYRM